MSEDPLTDCPACGQPQLRKVVNSVGVVFKGNGFYVTDNRNGAARSVNGTNNGKSEASSEASSETTEKKSDSTPAKTEAVKSSSTSEKVAATAA
jgi:predicted nucleic acid-binding Zn ribbon protein